MTDRNHAHGSSVTVQIPTDNVVLEGDLTFAEQSGGVVIFVHGSGSSRLSPRNRYVADTLNQAGLSTLLFDLLTQDEEVIDTRTAELRFHIPLLAQRLVAATRWLLQQPNVGDQRLGYFGASTGAAAALIAAAEIPESISAVVSRGGRPDLAGSALPYVRTPTLLIVGGNDLPVLTLNRRAYNNLRCEKRLQIVAGATHLFEERGALEEVAGIARDWFRMHLIRGDRGAANNSARHAEQSS